MFAHGFDCSETVRSQATRAFYPFRTSILSFYPFSSWAQPTLAGPRESLAYILCWISSPFLIFLYIILLFLFFVFFFSSLFLLASFRQTRKHITHTTRHYILIYALSQPFSSWIWLCSRLQFFWQLFCCCCSGWEKKGSTHAPYFDTEQREQRLDLEGCMSLTLLFMGRMQ